MTACCEAANRRDTRQNWQADWSVQDDIAHGPVKWPEQHSNQSRSESYRRDTPGAQGSSWLLNCFASRDRCPKAETGRAHRRMPITRFPGERRELIKPRFRESIGDQTTRNRCGVTSVATRLPAIMRIIRRIRYRKCMKCRDLSWWCRCPLVWQQRASCNQPTSSLTDSMWAFRKTGKVGLVNTNCRPMADAHNVSDP